MELITGTPDAQYGDKTSLVVNSTTRSGLGAGLLLTSAGLGCAMLPGLTGILTGAVLIGAGTGLITPLGFAALAWQLTAPQGGVLGEPAAAARMRFDDPR